MGAKTGIEWTDTTWNPIRGCTRVSEGCRNCYAEKVALRFSGPGLPYEGLAVLKHGHASWTGKIEFVEKHLLDPLRWKTPKRIFVNSMSDIFHENVTDEMRDKIFAVMALCPQHTFQVLTKRPARMREYLAGLDIEQQVREAMIGRQVSLTHLGHTGEPVSEWSGLPILNVWLGVSVENQATADERIPLLLQTPAAVRFISAEPLLGPIDLTRLNTANTLNFIDSLIGVQFQHGPKARTINNYCYGRPLDWVICGGESGPGARPMHPDWARGLRDQCAGAGVPFFFKQWGEYLPPMTDGAEDRSGAQVINASDDYQRVGKHAAGALLDGQEWKQFPKEAPVGSL